MKYIESENAGQRNNGDDNHHPGRALPFLRVCPQMVGDAAVFVANVEEHGQD